MYKIEVRSAYRSYPVIIGSNAMSQTGKFLKNADKVLVVTDENVNALHGTRLTEVLNDLNTFVCVLKPGEKYKNLASVTRILDVLKEGRFTRESYIIAFGGGVVGDIAAFAASVYMRGIGLIQIPTTLLSCVDSSVGGKTGIDYKGIKNLVGSFYNPFAVMIEPDLLKTLPAEEFVSGLGEVIKYKFLIGGKFYNSSNDADLTKIIKECLGFKASVTVLDEKDEGIRKILNLGHTFGHAYESSSNYKIKHGEAVALGIVSSLHLSYLNGIITAEKREEFLKLPKSIISNSLTKKINIDKTLSALELDKKKSKGETGFVLIKSPGEITTDYHSDDSKIVSAIELTFQL